MQAVLMVNPTHEEPQDEGAGCECRPMRSRLLELEVVNTDKMMVKRITNKEWQKYGERYALNILTDELKIPRDSIVESESPDFMFKYEGKQIGAEIVEYHRDPKETEARKAYQKAINKYKGKKGMLTSIMIFDENVRAFNRMKSENQLLDEIDNLLEDQYYEAQHLQSADEWKLDSESELPVSICSIGVCNHVIPEILEQTIRKKESKLTLYQKLHKNIDEYWLIVYVNMHEYDYFKNMETPIISTLYNRIYLTHTQDGILRIK